MRACPPLVFVTDVPVHHRIALVLFIVRCLVYFSVVPRPTHVILARTSRPGITTCVSATCTTILGCRQLVGRTESCGRVESRCLWQECYERRRGRRGSM